MPDFAFERAVDNEKVVSYHWREPFATLIEATEIVSGGDGVTLFETRPLEDILADIAEGWDSTRRCMGRVRASAFTEVSYVL